MKTIKWLDGKFERTEKASEVCYIIHKGEVELCTEHDTAYPVITRDEILKLAEILKEEK